MTKILCLAVCMLLAPLAIAKDNYIRVIGQGPTLDKAKDNAFREAIQIKVGSVVLSERESTIKQINKDDISVYSAGYIQDFKLVAVIATDGNVIATIDVLVSESKLVDQRLSSGKSSGEFDGVTANVRYTSFMDQKNRGDKILNSVLASYPQSALIIIQKPHNILIDSYPFGGCNTTLDAFHFNKIVLTLPSKKLNGRFTIGFYKKMKISEPICVSANDLIEKAVYYMKNIDARKKLETKISKRKYLLFKY